MGVFWRKLEEYLFHPPSVRWLVWLYCGPLFVVGIATACLLAFSPYHSIILILTLFAHLAFWKVSPKIGLAAISALLIFAVFCLPQEMRWWNGIWLVSLASALVVSLYAISEATRFFKGSEKKAAESLKDAELWQNRFVTMQQKIVEDRKVWENEMDVLRGELEEKKSYVNSLKTLLEVIHRETAAAAKRIQDLQERQVENFEIDGKVITKEEVEKIINDLKSQEIAIQERQKRNQSLLGTTKKKSISLKDLAPKV